MSPCGKLEFYKVFTVVVTLLMNNVSSLSVSDGLLSALDTPALREWALSFANIPETGRMQFCELANYYGLPPCEEHEVITEDGYVLKMFRVNGSGKDSKARPVMIVHGFLDSSDSFILRGDGSPVSALAAVGKDVWVPNLRGNMYSRRHLTLNPDTDVAFWKFSFDEFGRYDLPASIDYVLNRTGLTRLQVVAHSEGTTSVFVMGSELPEYNDKIALHVAMGPVATEDQPGIDLTILELLAPLLLRTLDGINKHEILGNHTGEITFLKVFCSQPNIINYLFCSTGLLALYGIDFENLEPEFSREVIGHYPSGTSKQNAIHFNQQFHTKRFAKYDYGIQKNLALYNSPLPPLYDLGRVTMRTAIITALNDQTATEKSAEKIKTRLPNVVDFFIHGYPNANHMDYYWFKQNNIYLYPHLIDILNKYNY